MYGEREEGELRGTEEGIGLGHKRSYEMIGEDVRWQTRARISRLTEVVKCFAVNGRN